MFNAEFVKKLRRLLLALHGQDVQCQAENCRIKGLTCESCPVLSVDTARLNNQLITRYIRHRHAA